MTLSQGSRLGAYEISAQIGAGGMGEVYRARDPKLGRDVAIKVLPESFSQDADALLRFEREARAVAALSHPNILSIFDFGKQNGTAFAVMELLEGETLRGRLGGGALGQRKCVEIARQIAQGLAAAHEKGIVHRDLKPENVFVTSDGRVKILDFGLAKKTIAEAASDATNTPTASKHTEPGVVLGTVGYMSPEQVKGKPADHRSDIFSFGAILHEMLSGTRAFQRDSAVETMSAILREDPPDLSATNKNVSPSLQRIVRHCLEKNPEERFYSARDVAFDLDAVSESSSAQPALSGAPRRAVLARAATALALLAAAAAGYAIRARRAPPPLPSLHQLTFRRGTVGNARFGSDGKSVLYGAAWDGGGGEIFQGRSDGPDARPFGIADAEVLAASSAGELAVSLRPRASAAFTNAGTLARIAAAGGGAPREVLDGVEFADFAPDGKELAVVREVSGRRRLEYPIGKVLYETNGWIGWPRVSPRGDRIAFFDHPIVGDDAGRMAIVDLSGKKAVLTPLFATAAGLGWSPDGSEIWFTAADVGGNRSLRSVTPSGRIRDLYKGTGVLTLTDVSRDGRVLLRHDVQRVGLVAVSGGKERDLSWFDWSLLVELSADGRSVLFSESGEGGGEGYSVCLRTTDGAPAVRLGEGQGESISPDGRRVLTIVHPTGEPRLVVYPTGAGEGKTFSFGTLRPRSAAWLPDGRRFLLLANESGQHARAYLVDAEKGDPKPLGPELLGGALIADARHFLCRLPDRSYRLFSFEGGEGAPVSGLGARDAVIDPTERAGWVYARRGVQLPAHIVRLELATGREEPWKDVMPADATGVSRIPIIRIAPDGKSYAYSYGRILSDLYVVEGLR
ncbi:MAG TPA: protein kinase [Thermoanaerobaculia bacterium]|nr:protein kinase [Thermoanaerobaculia bacterium]